MGKMISIADYAAKHSRSAASMRRKAAGGGFATARKIGGVWCIDEDEPYNDARITTGAYVGWRKGGHKRG